MPTEKNRAFALEVARQMAATRATNVVVLDLRGRSPVTEFFVIATGSSQRQMRTVVDELRDFGAKNGFKAWHVNGYENARWILIDFVNVVGHVFDIESRDFYDLELLWGDCPRIDWRQELGLPEAATERSEMDDETALTDEDRSRAAGEDIDLARAEERHMDGDPDEDEETDGTGDSDLDEDAESATSVVVEFPTLDAQKGQQFVETDSPGQREGDTSFPANLREEEADESLDNLRPVAKGSLDQDEQERFAERMAELDPEAVSSEDLPEDKLNVRPMGGVSAGLSSTEILDDDEDQQREDIDMDEEGPRERITPATAADADPVVVRKPEADEEGQAISTRQSVARAGGRGKRTPTSSREAAAPPSKTSARGKPAGSLMTSSAKRTKGGALKTSAGRLTGKKTTARDAGHPKAKKTAKPAAKASTRGMAKKAPAKKSAPAKKPAARKPAAKKSPAKKTPAKKPAAKRR